MRLEVRVEGDELRVWHPTDDGRGADGSRGVVADRDGVQLDRTGGIHMGREGCCRGAGDGDERVTRRLRGDAEDPAAVDEVRHDDDGQRGDHDEGGSTPAAPSQAAARSVDAPGVIG